MKRLMACVVMWGLGMAVLSAGVIPLNKWKVIGPIPEAAYVEAEADRFLAEPLEEVCGVKAADYVNPRNPEGDGLYFLDFFGEVPHGKAMAYAAVEVEAEAGYYVFTLNTDFTAEIFVNGESRCKAFGDSWGNVFFAKFHEGANRIAVKSYHEEGYWAVVLAVVEGPLDEEEYRQALAENTLRQRIVDFSYNSLTIGGYFVGTVGTKPELTWDNPANAAEMFGKNPQQITWFDETMQATEDFRDSGLYYALLETETADGKPYKALFSYYLLPEGWKEDPEIVEFAGNFQWQEPFDGFQTTWTAIPQRLKLFRDSAGTDLGLASKPGVAPAVVAWRQRAFPVETVRLAPPIELTKAAPALRYGSEEEAGFLPGSREKFDALCRELYEKTRKAFYTVIARNGVIVYARGYGELAGKPINIATPCSMASMSKLFTGLLFARFLDQGLMELDEDMSRFMPALAGTPEWKLTPRRCFNHTSNFTGHGNFGGIRNPLGEYGIACWLPVVKPGSAWSYNGVGPNLMGMYMMNATALPIDRLFAENYYRQLGITSMSGDDQGGGYLASADDLAKLAQLLLNRGSYGKWQFFEPKTYELLMPRNLAEDNPGTSIEGYYGVGIQPFWPPAAGEDDIVYYGHGAASGTVFSFDPKYQTMVIQARDENSEANDEYRKKLEQLVWDSVAR